MTNLTARQLVQMLHDHIAAHSETGDLPAVAIDEERLLNIVGVDLSTLHDGLMLLQGRDFDRPG